jgi:hypothetical protein
MSNRLKHPKGPSKMKANFMAPVLINDDEKVKPILKLHKGFTGFPGWTYHPTRGFKKVAGFKPDVFQKLSAV